MADQAPFDDRTVEQTDIERACALGDSKTNQYLKKALAEIYENRHTK